MTQLDAPLAWDPHLRGSLTPFRFLSRRAAFVLLSLGFAAAFCWNYMVFQVVALSSFNIYYAPTPLSAWITAFVIFLIPALVVPTELVRPSSFAVLMQYALVLMPVCFVPMFRQEMPLQHLILLAASFAVAILILLAMNKAPRKVLPIPRLRGDVGWPLFAALYVAFNAIVALTGPHWQLVNFLDVYDVVRQQSIDYQDTLYAYAYMTLAWTMNPFLIATAIARKNYWLVVIASFMEVYLYGYGGFKSMVFVPLLVIGSYFLVKRFRQPATKAMLAFLALIIITTIGYVSNPSPLNFAINSLYETRTIGMAGQNTAGFDYFAYNHGFTYWAHLKGVNKLVHYNFKQDVGNEVGLLEQGYNTQANTGFLATDGLSALGLAGVILISFVVGGYFWLVDCAASGHDSAFAVAAFSVPSFVLVNAGFFTSLLSTGTLLIVILLQFMPLVTSDVDRRPAVETDFLPVAPLQESQGI
ncbi:MAG: hypothetical protein WA476_01205 [Acidobacteriaceae bacterium]